MIEVKRIRVIILGIVLLGALSCSSQYGPTEDEIYAGAWIGDSMLGIEEVVEMTDTTFEVFVHYQGLNGYLPGYKGFVSYDETNSALYVVTTHIYQLDDYTVDTSTGKITANSTYGYYEPADEANSEFSELNVRTNYTIAVTTDTMTYDSTYTMYRTQPVSDSLLD